MTIIPPAPTRPGLEETLKRAQRGQCETIPSSNMNPGGVVEQFTRRWKTSKQAARYVLARTKDGGRVVVPADTGMEQLLFDTMAHRHVADDWFCIPCGQKIHPSHIDSAEWMAMAFEGRLIADPRRPLFQYCLECGELFEVARLSTVFTGFDQRTRVWHRPGTWLRWPPVGSWWKTSSWLLEPLCFETRLFTREFPTGVCLAVRGTWERAQMAHEYFSTDGVWQASLRKAQYNQLHNQAAKILSRRG